MEIHLKFFFVDFNKVLSFFEDFSETLLTFHNFELVQANFGKQFVFVGV